MAAHDSNYATQSARWDAYQFSDPFAATVFVCANKKLDIVCRPSCDHYPKVAVKEDVSFMDNINQALAAGFKPCAHCDPCNRQFAVDVQLLKETIDSINNSIGFTNDANEMKRRAFSTPSINTTDGHISDRQLTRNESEHVKLVELACRHIASAAAENLSKQQDQSGGKKKRRGGVLGFKELASKSKLSPWHFHRVFKSVTGLTPKSYGDQCWKFMKNRDARPQQRPQMKQRTHFRSNSDITNNYQRSKRVKREEAIDPTAHTPLSSVSPSSVKSHEPKAPINNLYPMVQTPVMQTQGGVALDTSLDINVAPMRHHSLDLGTVGLDSFDLDLTPEFVPVSQLGAPMPQMAVDFDLANTQAAIPQFQPSNIGVMPSASVSTRAGSAADDELSSMNMFVEESQWPSIVTETPVQDMTRLLTPPSSVSEPDLKESIGEMYNPMVNASPLDNDMLFAMHDLDGQSNNASNHNSTYELFGADVGDSSAFLFGNHAHDEEFEKLLKANGSKNDTLGMNLVA